MKKTMILMCIFASLLAKNTFAEEKCSNNFANAKIINTTINNIVIQCGSEKINLPVFTLDLPYATDNVADLKYIAKKFNRLYELQDKIIYLNISIDGGHFNPEGSPNVVQASEQGYQKSYAGLALELKPNMMDSFFSSADNYSFLYYLDASNNESVREAGDGLNYYHLLFPKKTNSSFSIKAARTITIRGLARIEFSGFNGGTVFFEILPVEAQGPYLNSYQDILDRLKSGELKLEGRDWYKNELDPNLLDEPLSTSSSLSKVEKKNTSSDTKSNSYESSNLLPKDQCAIIVASRKTLPEVREYIYENIKDRRYLRVLEASNGWYAISIGTLKPHEEEPVMSKWKASGKIPQDSFCSSGKKMIREVNWE